MLNFNLKVQLIENTCLFELVWGECQQLNTILTYPKNIVNLYHEWQECYLKFYKHSFRGKVAEIGTIAAPPMDWRAKLVEAETKLLYEFRHWLRDAELYQIRSTIINYQLPITNSRLPITQTNIFITCNSLELERLPWEAWNIGNEFAVNSDIRIVRKPINISKPTTISNRQRKARILAILGDDTGLGFEVEKKALKSLKKLVDVKFIGWEPGKDINQLKEEIVKELSDNIGWDILFFAGHSNETNLTGGEIFIAPNTALYLSEIQTPLTIAKENGLQVAIFNSCKGLSIANKLIDLGFSQVAIMREPIHNQVASEFFIQFSQALAEYKDVHESLLEASEYLNQKNYLYPSSYLIPSLFRHPAAPLFRIQPSGFKQTLTKLIPTPLEAVTISALALISLQLPVQDWLLERRVLVQAVYRQLTNQVDANITPPVLLVEIDNESINKAKIYQPRPINREYLAQIVDKLVELKAPIVGVNYLLDRHDDNLQRVQHASVAGSRILSNSIKAGLTSSSPTNFIFSTTRDNYGNWLTINPQIATEKWSLFGENEVIPGWYMQLLPSSNDKPKPRPFAAMLALSQELQQIPESPKPQLTSKQEFWTQVNTYINNDVNNRTVLKSERARLQPLTAFSYYLGQMWLHPIVDFSIPPKQVYQTIPAWKLLQEEVGNKESNLKLIFSTPSSPSSPSPPSPPSGCATCYNGGSLRNAVAYHLPIPSPHPIIIIAAGGYGEAGAVKDNEDNFELPAAMAYWRNQDNPDLTRGVLTSGKAHAYMTHHYLKNRMVIPIPDLWMIGLTIVLSKMTLLYLSKNPEQNRKYLILITISYTIISLISLQLYISSAAILLPWLLPTITFWFYILSASTVININQ
ncbi:MAG: CHASE2 domain-containing protein [Cyanobacteria bacterium P01_D01_bin.116]